MSASFAASISASSFGASWAWAVPVRIVTTAAATTSRSILVPIVSDVDGLEIRKMRGGVLLLEASWGSLRLICVSVVLGVAVGFLDSPRPTLMIIHGYSIGGQIPAQRLF